MTYIYFTECLNLFLEKSKCIGGITRTNSSIYHLPVKQTENTGEGRGHLPPRTQRPPLHGRFLQVSILSCPHFNGFNEVTRTCKSSR